MEFLFRSTHAKIPPVDRLKLPPLVMLFREDDRKSGCGLGIMLAPNWVVTAEHLVAGGRRDYCDRLLDQSLIERRIKCAFVEDEFRAISPGNFAKEMMAGRPRVKPLDERLVMLNIQSEGVVPLFPSIGNYTGVQGTLLTCRGAPTSSRGSTLIPVSLGKLRKYGNTSYFQTEEFAESEAPRVVVGDSGGGVFAVEEDSWTLVGIQTAMTRRNVSPQFAIGIPLSRAQTWLTELISGG